MFDFCRNDHHLSHNVDLTPMHRTNKPVARNKNQTERAKYKMSSGLIKCMCILFFHSDKFVCV